MAAVASDYLRYLLKITAAGILFAAAGSAGAIDLITDEEARLPATPKMATRGGITRGPSIKVVSPSPDGPVKAPFALKIEFQAHGGSKIDAGSVKVTYLKKPAVDRTARRKGCCERRCNGCTYRRAATTEC